MKDIYVFGNEFLEFDNFALEVAKALDKKFNIIRCTSPDDLLSSDDGKIVILDVVKGARKPMLIEDVSKIKSKNMLSLHDFDLGFFLNLMKEMGIKRKIKIIGIPDKGNAAKTAVEVKKWV